MYMYLPRVRTHACRHTCTCTCTSGHTHIIVILIDVEFYSKHLSVFHIQYTKCSCTCIHELLLGRNLRINFSIREDFLVVKTEVPVLMQHIMQCIWPKLVVDFLIVTVRQNN